MYRAIIVGYPEVTVVDKLVIPGQENLQGLLPFVASITGETTQNMAFVMR